MASLDWPRGKPVRVTPVASQGLKVALSSGRDWFAVDGEVQVDDTRVISLQRLMDLLHESRQGRFVSLGEGEYLALTDRLRAQMAELRSYQAEGFAWMARLAHAGLGAILADGILQGQDQGKPVGAAELRALLGKG